MTVPAAPRRPREQATTEPLRTPSEPTVAPASLAAAPAAAGLDPAAAGLAAAASAARTPLAPAAVAPGGSLAAPVRREVVAWLLQVARPVLPPLAASTLCRIADQLAGVSLFALGAYTAVATATALTSGAPAPSLRQVVLVMVGLSLLKALLRYGEQLLGHLVAFKALELLRAEIFQALIPRAPRVMASARSGDLLALATKDVDRIEVFFAHTFAPMVSAVVVPSTVLVATGLATSWGVAGAALPFLLLALLGAPLAGWRAALGASRATAAARAELTSHVTDTIQGMSEVVGYGRTAERLAATARLDDAVAAAFRPARVAASLRRGAIALLVLVGPVAMLAVGAPAVTAGRVGLAPLAAAVAAVVRLTECVRGVEELTAYLNSSFASAERVYAVVHGPVAVADGHTELPARAAPSGQDGDDRQVGPDLAWEEVTYAYPGTTAPVLRGVSLWAQGGRWTSLVGASGSGKTTLAQLALRFDDPGSGTVRVSGYDLRELTADSLRRQVHLVSQHAHLFRASIAQNLRLAAPQATDAELEAACRTAGVHEDVIAMGQGYQTAVGERGASLSGGQRQRLALARSLLAEPRVLVLDEFTSHLDPALEVQVRENVRRWAQQRGATVVEITHRLHRIEQADHVVVLDAGAVVQEGEPRSLLAVDGPLRRLAAREGLGAEHLV